MFIKCLKSIFSKLFVGLKHRLSSKTSLEQVLQIYPSSPSSAILPVMPPDIIGKTYGEISNSALICSLIDDQGNVIATKNVSDDFKIIDIVDGRFVLTNLDNVDFPSLNQDAHVRSLTFLGTQKDGTPYIVTIPYQNNRER